MGVLTLLMLAVLVVAWRTVASSPVTSYDRLQLLPKKTEFRAALPDDLDGRSQCNTSSSDLRRSGQLLERFLSFFSPPTAPPNVTAVPPSPPSNRSTPIVLWHGLGQSCCDPDGVGRVKAILERVANAYVYSVRIGETTVDEVINSFFEPVNAQVEAACRQIASDPQLASGYHAVGFSQGGQFLRAVAQRCPDPPMKTLVTLGSQHQGIFGLPKCDLTFSLCKIIRSFIGMGVYTAISQSSSVPAQYWHDPLNPSGYANGSIFLADINNEGNVKNKTYKENLTKLEKFVMIKSLNDSVVVPVESQHFEFFDPSPDDVPGIAIKNLRKSRIYTEDWLGLKELDASGRLIFMEVQGDHLEFNANWFIQEVVLTHLVP